MVESFDEQVSRCRLMEKDAGNWDLSPNDRAAIRAVLARLDALAELVKSLDGLSVCYRVGSSPSEALLDRIAELREKCKD